MEEMGVLPFSTIKKEPIKGSFKWSGRRDSNPRQPAWKAGTLSTELLPHLVIPVYNKPRNKSIDILDIDEKIILINLSKRSLDIF